MSKNLHVIAVCALISVLSAAAQERHAGAVVVLDAGRIEQLTGAKGVLDATEGVFKIMMPRTDLRISVAGDFAMLERELQDVIKTLRAGGINIVAIHNHMTAERPRIMFLHYWGVGRTEDLAHSLRAALDRTASGGR